MERLQDSNNQNDVLAYLKSAIREDENDFLIAIKYIIDAQGKNISQLSRNANLNREHLYKIFSYKGNPTWKTINAILNQIGFELTVQRKSC